MREVAKQISNILTSDAFKSELKELASYAVHVKQEKPIKFLLAKHFFKNDLEFILEWPHPTLKRRKYDFIFNSKTIEVKYFFEFDLLIMSEELEKMNGDIEKALKSNKSQNWTVLHKILEDIIKKDPNLFLLIIHSRDLTPVINNVSQLRKICMANKEMQYSKYCDPETFAKMDELFEKIKLKRQFSHSFIDIPIETNFRSRYRFYLCEFNT